MRLKSKTECFPLSAEGIDACAAWLASTLPAAGLDHRNALRVRLLAEELLLRMQEHLEPQTLVTVSIDVLLGRAALRLELEGKAFNPLSETAQELGEWNSSLLAAVGLRPRYSFSGEKNTLRLPLPQKHMNPVLKMLLFFLVGIGAGLLGLWLLPQTVRETYSAAALEPTFDLWTRILNAASGPIIFFMALTTILNTRAITRQGGSSVHVIVRYLVITFLMVAAALVCASPVFSVSQMRETAPHASWYEALTATIPGNLVEPLLKSDTPQLLLLAFALGATLIAAGDHAKTLRRCVREINIVGSLVSRNLSQTIPFVAGLFLCLEIWTQRVKLLIGFWKPLALSFGVSVLLLVLSVLWFAFRMKLRVLSVPKKLVSTFLTTLRGAPLDESMEAAERACTRQLGVDSKYAKVCLPQGTVLFMPISAIGTLIFTMYLLNTFQIHLNLAWQIITVLLVEILFVATPPVPGANLLAFSALFSWIGIPGDAILDAMLFDILFGFFASAANLTLLQMETVQQAERLGLLNSELLQKPVAPKKVQ